MKPDNLPAWAKLLILLLLCYGAAALGGWATAQSVNGAWYAGLQKPVFQPPGWLFGPVWTLLYGLMALAAWRIWRLGLNHRTVKFSLILFGIQLTLNVLWSFVFFAWQNPAGALAEILILWAAIGLTGLNFWRLARPAAYLLLPYWLWVGFASLLNAAIVWLN